MPPLKRGSSMIRANLKNLRNANYFLSCKNKKEFHKHELKQLLVTSCFSYTANFSWAQALSTLCPSEICFESSPMAKGCSRRGHHFHAPLEIRAFP